MKLKSPFNGEVWMVPQDASPGLVEALLARGFTREVDAPVKAVKRNA